MKILPGIWRLRNGKKVIVERVKPYNWTNNYSKGSIVIVEGVDPESWNLMMWNTSGQRMPTDFFDDQFDLVELTQETPPVKEKIKEKLEEKFSEKA